MTTLGSNSTSDDIAQHEQLVERHRAEEQRLAVKHRAEEKSRLQRLAVKRLLAQTDLEANGVPLDSWAHVCVAVHNHVERTGDS